MLHDERAVTLGADGHADAWAEFRVTGLAERMALMRQLRDANVPVQMQSPTGGAMSSTLWSLDDQRQRLSFNADDKHPHLQNLLECGEVAATAYLDSVKLQFELHDMVIVRSPQAVSLQASLPAEVFRFQRRSAFRVRVADRLSPTALFRHPSMPEMQLSLRVLDVSATGCSMWLPGNVPPLQPGTELTRVVVMLDETTRFTATVKLQHVTVLSPNDPGVRLGCEWQASSPASERTLQRWVDAAQRRSRIFTLT
jgi:c-di-GMP-binding flagellar brake protein YcgR